MNTYPSTMNYTNSDSVC